MEFHQKMDRVESLMSTAPDSALSLLQQIPTNKLRTDKDHAQYAVLLEMALDKNYLVNKQDSSILAAYNYYSRNGNKENKMKSAYYLGLVHRNAGRNLEAVIEFIEAENWAKEGNDNHYLGLIYWQLMELFYANYDAARALQYAQKESEAFNTAGEKLSADYAQWDIAYCYISLQRWEDAADTLLPLLNRCSDPSLRILTLGALAKVRMYQPSPDYEAARLYYDTILAESTDPLSVQDYCQLAYLNSIFGKSDEEKAYMALAEKSLLSSSDSIVFHNTQQNIYDRTNQIAPAYNALINAVRIQNRQVMTQLEQSVTHSLESFYAKNLDLERERSRSQRMFVFMLVFCLVLLLIIGGLVLHEQRRRIIEDMSRIQFLASDLERQRSHNSAVSLALEEIVNSKIRTLIHLSDAYFKMDSQILSAHEEKQGWVSKEEIISSFRHLLGTLRDKKETIAVLEKALNISENGLIERLRMQYPRLKDSDFSFLTLLFSGVSIKSISYIMEISESAVRMRKTRYKQFFESSPEEVGQECVRWLS